MFKKKKEQREKTKLEKRVASLPSTELVGWSENALYSVSRNLSTWQKSGDTFYLEEANVGIEALKAIVDTLRERAQ
jgi:hypothetical protein